LKYLLRDQNLNNKNDENFSVPKKRKRGDDDIEEDIKKLNNVINEKKIKVIFDEDEEDEGDEEYIPSSNKKKSKTKSTRAELNQKDVKELEIVDNIINVLKENTVGKEEDEILKSLYKTSFDIENTYLALNDPNLFKGKLLLY